jgi:hypothetical protein
VYGLTERAAALPFERLLLHESAGSGLVIAR